MLRLMAKQLTKERLSMSLREIKKRHSRIEHLIAIGDNSVQNPYMQSAHLDRQMLLRALRRASENPASIIDDLESADLKAAIGVRGNKSIVRAREVTDE